MERIRIQMNTDVDKNLLHGDLCLSVPTWYYSLSGQNPILIFNLSNESLVDFARSQRALSRIVFSASLQGAFCYGRRKSGIDGNAEPAC